MQPLPFGLKREVEQIVRQEDDDIHVGTLLRSLLSYVKYWSLKEDHRTVIFSYLVYESKAESSRSSQVKRDLLHFEHDFR